VNNCPVALRQIVVQTDEIEKKLRIEKEREKAIRRFVY